MTVTAPARITQTPILRLDLIDRDLIPAARAELAAAVDWRGCFTADVQNLLLDIYCDTPAAEGTPLRLTGTDLREIDALDLDAKPATTAALQNIRAALRPDDRGARRAY
ncbi:hypothetical protein [Pseudoclavibacter sp. AY1F1]|uniref:hypothetical protein n=1 Tax=Pseudoclavibacter sp. AY1F1 TaxID=2080583 RepID=UPI0015E3A0E5|nr:hypothetical protein [Pseudoclavibacter sp. AY1F1]